MSDNTTRERILDVAEKLFAENGFDATSLRGITAAADVNLAAVHYHFGSKTGLLQATIRRRIEPVNAERLRRLDVAIAAAEGGVPEVEAIIDAFLRPAIEAFADFDTRLMVGMLALVHSRELEPTFVRETFGEVVARFSILHRAVPHLTVDEVAWRLHFTIGAMIQAFNPRVTDVHPELGSWDGPSVADAIITFVAAGFRARPSTTYRQSPSTDGATFVDDNSSGRPPGQEQHR